MQCHNLQLTNSARLPTILVRFRQICLANDDLREKDAAIIAALPNRRRSIWGSPPVSLIERPLRRGTPSSSTYAYFECICDTSRDARSTSQHLRLAK